MTTAQRTWAWRALLLLVSGPIAVLATGRAYGFVTQQPTLQTAAEHDGVACRNAAGRAEREAGLPPGMLLAIGRQESGRWDASSGEILPWSFAINAYGTGRFFATKEEAVSHVAMLLSSGTQSVDVGCFQINLKHHPAAFASLEQAFDPEANAHYAAKFLVELHDATGNWDLAIGRYHSGTLALAEPYTAAVLGRWNHSPDSAPLVKRTSVQPINGVMVQWPGSTGNPYRGISQIPGLPNVITPTARNPTIANRS